MKPIIISATFAAVLCAQDVKQTTTTTTWNGVLVDASCHNSQVQRTETVGNRTTTTRTETTECPATMTTNSFGLLTADGHYIRFDNPSNTRVVEIVRKSATAPTRVKVIGTANGDVAVVESLVPAEGGYAERSETSTVSLDVRYGDDRGKLIISDSGLRFENVSHADKSQNWTYSQIREFHREDNNKVKIDPYRGDTFEFRLDGPKMADSVYKTISDRIVAARGR